MVVQIPIFIGIDAAAILAVAAHQIIVVWACNNAIALDEVGIGLACDINQQNAILVGIVDASIAQAGNMDCGSATGIAFYHQFIGNGFDGFIRGAWVDFGL